MNRFTFILGAAHGGTEYLNGHIIHLTPGKRSPEVPPGIIEGDWSRDVIAEVVGRVSPDLAVTCTTFGALDIPLRAQVKYVDKIHAVTKNAIFIPVHANAAGMGKKWRYDARGATCFHFPLRKKSKKLAEILLRNHGNETGIDISRGVRSRPFTALTTKCPSALLEAAFQTNKKDVEKLIDIEEQASGIVAALYELEERGL